LHKKTLKIILSILLLVGVISLYFVYASKNFENLLGIDERSITKVLMLNGNDGNYVETTDKEKIKELIDIVNNRTYKKALNQEKRIGYSYSYDFYSGDKVRLSITGHGDNVDINGAYYDVSEPISVETLAKWFNSLPVNVLK
jgi:hypothetical protein